MTTCLTPDMLSVRAALVSRARIQCFLSIAQIFFGLVATIFIPAAVAELCAVGLDFDHPWRHHADSLGFFFWFPVWFLIIMPAAYVIEWQTQGGYLLRKIREIRASSGWYQAIVRDPSWRWNGRDAAQWEIALFAPRMVFEGVTTLRGVSFSSAAPHPAEYAASILSLLVTRDHGVALDELPHADDELFFSRGMAYLLYFDWIGISQGGNKAWALSETRQQFNRITT